MAMIMIVHEVKLKAKRDWAKLNWTLCQPSRVADPNWEARFLSMVQAFGTDRGRDSERDLRRRVSIAGWNFAPFWWKFGWNNNDNNDKEKNDSKLKFVMLVYLLLLMLMLLVALDSVSQLFASAFGTKLYAN